jgi:hypothetical protein
MVLEGDHVIVVTIFGGQPPQAEISSFAAGLHARWGESTHSVDVRGEEDKKAMRLLGAEYLHLAYPDAIYRSANGSFLYQSDDELFGPLRKEDSGLVQRIAASVEGLAPPGDSSVYAPLAVGNHVDHQLVLAAIISLVFRSSMVAYYEDYPYVEVPGALTQTLEGLKLQQWELELREVDEHCLKAKIDAIGAYQSQMATLFGDEQEMAQRVQDYMGAISPQHGFAERYWRPKDSISS